VCLQLQWAKPTLLHVAPTAAGTSIIRLLTVSLPTSTLSGVCADWILRWYFTRLYVAALRSHEDPRCLSCTSHCITLHYSRAVPHYTISPLYDSYTRYDYIVLSTLTPHYADPHPTATVLGTAVDLIWPCCMSDSRTASCYPLQLEPCPRSLTSARAIKDVMVHAPTSLTRGASYWGCYSVLYNTVVLA
jgi:hypothetical protein